MFKTLYYSPYVISNPPHHSIYLNPPPLLCLSNLIKAKVIPLPNIICFIVPSLYTQQMSENI